MIGFLDGSPPVEKSRFNCLNGSRRKKLNNKKKTLAVLVTPPRRRPGNLIKQMKKESVSQKGHSKKAAVSQVRTGGKTILKTSARGKEWWTQAIAALPQAQQKLLAVCATTCNTEPKQLLQQCVQKHLSSLAERRAIPMKNGAAPTLPAAINPAGVTEPGLTGPQRVKIVADAFGKSEQDVSMACVFAGINQVIAEFNTARCMTAITMQAVICIEDCDTNTFRAVAFASGGEGLVYYNGKKFIPISLKDSVARVAALQTWWGELESGEHHFDEPTYLRWLGLVCKAM